MISAPPEKNMGAFRKDSLWELSDGCVVPPAKFGKVYVPSCVFSGLRRFKIHIAMINGRLGSTSKQVNSRWIPSQARLFVKVKFMYSKIVPLRNRIYALQDRKRSVEKEMTLLQIGGGGGGDEA